VVWVFLKLVGRQAREVHPLMWIVFLAFLVYFAQTLIQQYI
jgi:xanthine/uracil/vitamin C permease (AzgA family)